uniref:DUF8041 domain-containing protein n=1 Tax=Brassica oleracea var. oleracea TaxID=109376 RepID=A0A0D3E1S5_BRAOL
MQRKHYRGLSNPQCLHGIEFVPSPRWMELTGRDLKFTIPPDASDFGSWRNLPNTEFELELERAASRGAEQRQEDNLTIEKDQSPGHGVGGCNVSKKRKDFLSPGSSEEECCLTVNNVETQPWLGKGLHWSYEEPSRSRAPLVKRREPTFKLVEGRNGGRTRG